MTLLRLRTLLCTYFNVCSFGKVPFIAPGTFANSATWNQYNMLFCRPPSRICNVIRYPSPIVNVMCFLPLSFYRLRDRVVKGVGHHDHV